jgi:hypothetical protein
MLSAASGFPPGFRSTPAADCGRTGCPASQASAPVLNEQHVTMIAREWNVQESEDGAQTIVECWIPVEDLGALNANIVGKIELTAEFH